jgi:hypothetical protein
MADRRMTDPGRAASAIYRLVFQAGFTVLCTFITVRQLLEGEWFNAAVAALLAIVIGWAAMGSWRTLRWATRIVPADRAAVELDV